MMDIDQAISAVIWDGSPEPMREVTRLIAPANIGRLYKALIRMSSTHFMMSRLQVAWKNLFEQGDLHYEQLTGDSALMQLKGAVLPLYMCAHGVCGWLEAALQMRGLTDFHVEHSTCIHQGDSRCSWTAHWK